MDNRFLGIMVGGALCLASAAASAEKESWKAPFGGVFSATFAFTTDYSYRGISQTQRQVAPQAAIGYETAPVSENVLLSAYVGAGAPPSTSPAPAPAPRSTC